MFYHSKGKTNLDPDFELLRGFCPLFFSVVRWILSEKKIKKSRIYVSFLNLYKNI